MNKPKISVIMPIYNVEEYLEDSLNCLLKQSFIDDMEVLMIDDGSTDNSRYIVEKYALDYDNFHAFHQENGGISSARNRGIDLAKGEYITFFDADDYLNPNGYESLYKLAEKNKSDIVSSNMVRLKRYNIVDSRILIRGYKNITETLDSANLNDYPELIWDTFVWNKIYKREFINKNNIKFKPVKYYEDLPFGLESLILANKISIYNDIFYYWRIREGSNLSITQQHSDFENFKGRIQMISLVNELMNNNDLNEDIKNELYFRWVEHDLNLHLRIFYQYEEEFHQKIIEEVKKVLDLVPKEIMAKVNSIKKILYKMAENEDIEGLINFSKLIPTLMTNPHIPEDLGEEYKKLINFENDAKQEELKTKITEVSNDEENVYIEFNERINYLNDDYPHETKATLVTKNNAEYKLELNSENQIIIPIKLIKNKKHMKIKIEYIAQDFEKESFLTNSKRGIIEYDDFDVELGVEKNGIFFIDIRRTSDLKLNIQNIALEDDKFTFYGKSNERVNTVFIENVIDSEKIKYNTICKKIEDQYDVIFSIPYEDILSHHVRKWEIRAENKFKTIKVAKKFEFYKQYNRIYIINARNKLLISDDFYDALEMLDEKNKSNINLNKKVNKLKRENIKIKNENVTLIEDKNTLTSENEELTQNKNKLESLNEELTQNKNKLETQNEKLGQDQTKLINQNEELTQNISKLINQKEKLGLDISKLINLNEELKQDKTNLTNENKGLIEDKNTLTNEKEDLINKKSKLEKENNQLIKDKNTLENEKEILKQDKTSLTNEKNQLIEQKTNLINEKNQLIEQKTNLENQKEELTKGKTELENEKEKLTNEKNELIDENFDLLHENDELTKDKTKLENENKELIENKNTLENEKEKLTNENKELIENNTNLTKENNQLTKDKTNLTKENSKLMKDNAKLENEKEGIIKDRDILINEKEELKDKIEEYESRFALKFDKKIKRVF